MAMFYRERGLFELYRDDPERADALVFDRRGLLKGIGLATMGAMVGAAIPFGQRMPGGLIPAALAQGAPKLLKMDGKAELVILGDKPLVAETPEHLLDDAVTPTPRIFVRNNGQIPEPATDAEKWTLSVDGEVNNPLKLTLGELKSRFPNVTLPLQMECGGNGRSFFAPETRGNQWTNGAISNAAWTGVRLKDVLAAAQPKPSAVYTGHYGADPHLSGDASKPSISRGVPLAKAMEEHSLIVWAVNGQPLPNIHGYPLRLIIPGWPGSVSAKWLTRIWVREKEHDGPGMGATSYRVPVVPIVPGAKDDGKTFRNLESMPVRSIITNVAHGTELAAGTRDVAVRGQAWAGDLAVRQVDVSIDFGQSWTRADLAAPPNKFAWQRFQTTVKLPSAGYYEIWARATDANGLMQPHQAGNWNPQGYGGNPMHRVAVLAKS